jgi:hypothetical protein
MFISKKHIPRRTILKSAGAALALPLLEAMVPARTLLAQTAAVPAKSRFVGIFFPHGMGPGHWVPKTEGALTEMPYTLESLKNVRENTTVMSGLWSKSAEPPEGTTGSDHWVAAAFLTANKPRKTAGSDSTVYEPTIDQTIALKIGQDNLMPSLQLACEDPNSSSSNCGEGYSCSYTNSISWVGLPESHLPGDTIPRTSPLPMELNPQVVFERLFGSGATPEQRAQRLGQSRSILDSVKSELASLKTSLGAADKRTVDQYTDEIREIERRLQIAAKASTSVPEMALPSGIPEQFDDHIKLHFDLTALEFQADITRVMTMLGGRDLTGRAFTYPKSELFPEGGVSPSWHGASHHGDTADGIKRFADLNRYHVSTMARFAEKLKNTPDGDGTLLDHSLILYGTNMGNSNQHQHYDVAHILVGGANGKLKGGRHLAYDRKTVTTGNLLVSILDMYGISKDKQGDSTGPLPKLV